MERQKKVKLAKIIMCCIFLLYIILGIQTVKKIKLQYKYADPGKNIFMAKKIYSKTQYKLAYVTDIKFAYGVASRATSTSYYNEVLFKIIGNTEETGGFIVSDKKGISKGSLIIVKKIDYFFIEDNKFYKTIYEPYYYQRYAFLLDNMYTLETDDEIYAWIRNNKKVIVLNKPPFHEVERKYTSKDESKEDRQSKDKIESKNHINIPGLTLYKEHLTYKVQKYKFSLLRYYEELNNFIKSNKSYYGNYNIIKEENNEYGNVKVIELKQTIGEEDYLLLKYKYITVIDYENNLDTAIILLTVDENVYNLQYKKIISILEGNELDI